LPNGRFENEADMSTQSRTAVGGYKEHDRAFPKAGVSTPATIKARDVLVADLLESPIIYVGPKTTVREIALLLAKKKISGVPVVDHGDVVGIVSEGDLIRRHELGRSMGSVERSPEGMDGDRSKSHGVYACDVMERNVLMVSEDTPLPDIVETLLARNIRRLLVTRGGKLVGVISRSDIVRVLAARPEGAGEPMSDDDDIIRFRVIETLIQMSKATPSQMSVIVSKGVVELNGRVDDEAVRELSRTAVEKLPHVVKVLDRRASFQPQ
jgi:CBS domain-containing protein